MREGPKNPVAHAYSAEYRFLFAPPVWITALCPTSLAFLLKMTGLSRRKWPISWKWRNTGEHDTDFLLPSAFIDLTPLRANANCALGSQVHSLWVLALHNWRSCKTMSTSLSAQHAQTAATRQHQRWNFMFSYFVAEKSDGVRCLALLTVNSHKEPEVYLVKDIAPLIACMLIAWRVIVWSEKQLPRCADALPDPQRPHLPKMPDRYHHWRRVRTRQGSRWKRESWTESRYSASFCSRCSYSPIAPITLFTFWLPCDCRKTINDAGPHEAPRCKILLGWHAPRFSCSDSVYDSICETTWSGRIMKWFESARTCVPSNPSGTGCASNGHSHGDWSQTLYSVEFKEQQFTYHLDEVFNNIIPNLKHGNDGLIFTAVNAPYSLGTSEKM